MFFYKQRTYKQKLSGYLYEINNESNIIQEIEFFIIDNNDRCTGFVVSPEQVISKIKGTWTVKGIKFQSVGNYGSWVFSAEYIGEGQYNGICSESKNHIKYGMYLHDDGPLSDYEYKRNYNYYF